MANQHNLNDEFIADEETVASETEDAIPTGGNLAAETANMMRRSMRFYNRRMRTNNVHFNGEFGNATPICLDDQKQLEAIHVAETNDLFSTTVEEYPPDPRESEAEECTTPDLMPAVANNEQPVEVLNVTDFPEVPREHQERINIDTTVEDERQLAPEETANQHDHTDDSGPMESDASGTQIVPGNQPAANTNGSSSATTVHDTVEQNAMLPAGNVLAINTVKDNPPTLSQTTSSTSVVPSS